MVSKLKTFAAAALLTLQAGENSAQELGAFPIIGGMPVSCMGANTVVAPIPDIAMARPGVIILNPMLFNLPTATQLFIYAHECAHQIYGSSEDVADCWAAQTGRLQGWFGRRDLDYVLRTFGSSPGDWTHRPGPQRAKHIMACYDQA